MEAHLALTQPTKVNKIATSCEICNGPHDNLYCMENPEQAFIDYASSRTDEAGGRGFLATANAVIDCRMAKIAIGEGITRLVFGVKREDLGKEEAPYWTTLRKRKSYKLGPRSEGVGAQTLYYARKDFLDCYFPREWEISRDVELNPYKDTLVFRRMEYHRAPRREQRGTSLIRHHSVGANGCLYHGLRSEDPNQHLKDFLKLVDSLDLNGKNRERTRLRLFQFSLRDQASNWLESLPAGSITTWEDLTTRFLAQFFQLGRIAKLRNDILMFQQHHGESLSEAWTRFKDLLQKVSHHGIDLWLQVQIFYDRVNPVTRRAIDQSSGGKLRDLNAEESWALLEDLALYNNESRNDPRDFAKPVKAIALPQDVPKETDHIFGLADGTKSYPVGIVKDVEVHIGKLKLLNDFYVIDMKKDPETSLLVGRGFLAIANAIIDYRMAKIVESYKPRPRSKGVGTQTLYYARKDFLDFHLPGEWEISRDAELNPFKDTLVFRRMVEFLGVIPINLKCNRWESEDLIKKPINWGKPPKNRDGAWHAKIRLIDPDGEEFTKTLQSIPTTRKLFEKESPRDIIDWDHFYVT
nr:zinc finger, CCHC-type [Tanacetum cinerariifolium]